MKIKILFQISLIIGLAHGAIAQPPFIRQWDYRYGGTAGDYCVAFDVTIDEGYILAGKSASDSSGNKTTNTFGGGAFDYWIVKVNSAGIKQWEKNIRASGNDQLWSIKTTSDGGFLLGGTSDSPIGGDKTHSNFGGTDYWVLKLDSVGNIQWDNVYGGTGDEDLRFVMQTHDGGFLIGGDSRSGISGNKTEAKYGINDYWVVKTDANGVKLWDKVYGGPGFEQYRMSVQTADRGFIMAGQSSSGVGGNKTDNSNGGVDYWLVKTDSLGVIQWDNAYGGLGDDNLQTVILTSGGEIMCGGFSTTDVSGDKTQPTKGQNDIWILKLSSSGTILWDKDFGGVGIEDEFSCIVPSSSGGYYLGATSYSNTGGDKSEDNLGVEQPWVIKIDAAGNKIWDKTILTTGHDENCFIHEVPESNCIVVVSGDNGNIGGDKTQDAWGNLTSDYWIVKFCLGEATGNDNISFSESEVEIYPNPFLNQLKIRLNISSQAYPATVVLYDVVGNKIAAAQFNNEVVLNTNSISKGIYIVEVKNENKSLRKILVK